MRSRSSAAAADAPGPGDAISAADASSESPSVIKATVGAKASKNATVNLKQLPLPGIAFKALHVPQGCLGDSTEPAPATLGVAPSASSTPPRDPHSLRTFLEELGLNTDAAGPRPTTTDQFPFFRFDDTLLSPLSSIDMSPHHSTHGRPPTMDANEPDAAAAALHRHSASLSASDHCSNAADLARHSFISPYYNPSITLTESFNIQSNLLEMPVSQLPPHPSPPPSASQPPLLRQKSMLLTESLMDVGEDSPLEMQSKTPKTKTCGGGCRAAQKGAGAPLTSDGFSPASAKAAAAAASKRGKVKAQEEYHLAPGEEWKCFVCGAREHETPLKRKGPDKLRNYCNACYVRWRVKAERAERGSARPQLLNNGAYTAAAPKPLGGGGGGPRSNYIMASRSGGVNKLEIPASPISQRLAHSKQHADGGGNGAIKSLYGFAPIDMLQNQHQKNLLNYQSQLQQQDDEYKHACSSVYMQQQQYQNLYAASSAAAAYGNAHPGFDNPYAGALSYVACSLDGTAAANLLHLNRMSSLTTIGADSPAVTSTPTSLVTGAAAAQGFTPSIMSAVQTAAALGSISGGGSDGANWTTFMMNAGDIASGNAAAAARSLGGVGGAVFVGGSGATYQSPLDDLGVNPPYSVNAYSSCGAFSTTLRSAADCNDLTDLSNSLIDTTGGLQTSLSSHSLTVEDEFLQYGGMGDITEDSFEDFGTGNAMTYLEPAGYKEAEVTVHSLYTPDHLLKASKDGTDGAMDTGNKGGGGSDGKQQQQHDLGSACEGNLISYCDDLGDSSSADNQCGFGNVYNEKYNVYWRASDGTSPLMYQSDSKLGDEFFSLQQHQQHQQGQGRSHNSAQNPARTECIEVGYRPETVVVGDGFEFDATCGSIAMEDLSSAEKIAPETATVIAAATSGKRKRGYTTIVEGSLPAAKRKK